jgi:lipoprotein signal peptidase
VTDRHRHLVPLLRIACLVALGDYASKAAAARYLAPEPTVITDWLRFALVHNQDGAFGWSVGPYTWQLNLALTLGAIVFVLSVSRDLAGVDRTAPFALGLIVGGALGNFASLVLPPSGVVDFIALNLGAGHGVVLNLADLAAYTGLALIVRTGFLIVAEMRRTVRPHVETVLTAPLTPRLSFALADQEVGLEVVRADAVERSSTPELADVTPGSGPRLPLISDRPVTRPTRVIEFPVHLVDHDAGRDRLPADRRVPPADHHDTAR